MSQTYINTDIPTIADIERFLKYVNDSGSCWLWSGFKTPLGYGRFSFKGSPIYAHRFAVLIKEQWIIGLEVDHLCKNRGCVKPEHLEQVTHKLNLLRSEKQISTINSSKKTCTCGKQYEARLNGSRFCRPCLNSRLKTYRKEYRKLNLEKVRQQTRDRNKRLRERQKLLNTNG